MVAVFSEFVFIGSIYPLNDLTFLSFPPRLLLPPRNKTEIDAPKQADDTTEQRAVLEGHDGEAQHAHKRPKFLPGEDHGPELRLDVLLDGFERVSAQDGDAGDEQDRIRRGAEGLVEGEFDRGVFDVELLGCGLRFFGGCGSGLGGYGFVLFAYAHALLRFAFLIRGSGTTGDRIVD